MRNANSSARTLSGALLGLFGLVTTSGYAAAEPRRLTLDDAIGLAQQHNVTVLQNRSEQDIARAALSGVDIPLRYNPLVYLTGGPRMSDFGRSPQYGIEVTQQFEIGGQRAARVASAEWAQRAVDAQAVSATSAVSAQVQQQFGVALAAEQRVRLTEDTLALVVEGNAAAEERLKAGAIPLMELNTSRIEVGRAKLAHAKAQGEQAIAVAQLRLLIGLEPNEEVVPVGTLSVPVPPDTEVDALVNRAVTRRAEIASKKALVEAARAQEQLLEKELVPSPRLGASLMREEETNASIVQVLVSFDVPVFNRNRGQRLVAQKRVQQQEVVLRGTERRVKEEVIQAVTRLRAATIAVDGYATEVLAALDENETLASESYKAGKIGFLEFLVVRRQAIDARKEYIAALEELNSAWADFKFATGEP